MSAEAGDLIEVRSSLDAEQIAAIARLVDRVTEADGVHPLDEHVTLHIRRGGDNGAHHLLVWSADGGPDLVAYAHLDVTDEVEGAAAELAVSPEHRRRGVGHRLVEELVALSPNGRLRLWAHGENSASARLASSLGFSRSRVLWQMRRSLFATLPRITLPAGVRIRAFEPGRDDEAFIRVNARAFEHLSDQGSWTVEDLRLRMAEPWFDPRGFLLAVTGGEPGSGTDEQVIGFHWTKVHGSPDDHVHGQLGEVYVVGVDPDHQRGGLGRILTVAGLTYLRDRGLPQAMLYVDARNTNAIKVYESLGFVRWDTDVMFLR